ncbi:glycosyltransferase [Polynucleobacter paneuropaeus]|uniref:glycosyltransferase family 2 protein n=1 Tax=Polynucleobacter paneuropaeus TaxID=2527775 RepID=UPI001BFD19A5|nr:glycosyltransferase [Polynucleobacter paneuropaeus]QWD54504.1 glycosyltransferase [Polynucleobacter paneuropaeus]QWD56211.1 glycosyltransferase [Polynucleobacter paneuropaeus]
MNAQAELVSVVLPVYNGSQYLRQSIESILQQSYRNFELIIINDGSQDDSQKIIDSYNDSRIRAFEQANIGLAATLNKGISLAKGRWIARQDQDDVSFPERLTKQVHFMNTHPAYAIVGTAAQIWVNETKTDRFHRHPCSDPELRAGLVFYNYFVHSSVLLDKLILESIGGYTTDPERQPPEDYELWCRIARKHPVRNLPDVLLAYREVSSSMSRDEKNPFPEKLILLSAENIAWALGVSVELNEVQALANVMHRVYPPKLMRGFGWSKARNLFDQVIFGLALKTGLDQGQMQSQQAQLLKLLRLNYLDSLTGGRLNQMLFGKLRTRLKQFLKVIS